MPAISFTSSDGKDPEDSMIDFVRSLAPSPGKLQAAAEDQITRIKERTVQGTASDGSSFAPYSEKYAERRQKAGLGTSPVDLTVFSGDAAVYAEAHNEGNSRLPRRRWLDASDQDLEAFGNTLLPDA